MSTDKANNAGISTEMYGKLLKAQPGDFEAVRNGTSIDLVEVKPVNPVTTLELAIEQHPIIRTGAINYLPPVIEHEPTAPKDELVSVLIGDAPHSMTSVSVPDLPFTYYLEASATRPVIDEAAPFAQQAFDSIKLDIDWDAAPEGATHRNGPHGLWYKFDFVADTAMFCTDFARKWSDGDKASVYVADGSIDDMIARPAEPKEVWSLDGLDGNWNYGSLAELIKDNYGHGSDGGHPLESDGGLQVEDTVFRGIKHYDDPAGFLPDADDVANHMYEQASSSDAGEWADNYPHLDAQAEQELKTALEPLKAWARKHCQPTFFIVENVTTHELTEEDVRAAMAQGGAQ